MGYYRLGSEVKERERKLKGKKNGGYQRMDGKQFMERNGS